MVLNKLDIPGTEEAARAVSAAVKDREVLQISAVTRKGIRELTAKMINYLDEFNRDQDNVNEP